MLYVSTRATSKEKEKITASEAVCRGLAPDGGLYVPESIPSLSRKDIETIAGMSYIDRAAYILSLFFEEFTLDELKSLCSAAYSESHFPGGAAPVVNVHDNVYTLELWHGPTCAFKDMALQIMPHLFTASLRKTGESRHAIILVATSGDTGKAALEGYRDVDGVSVTVFYPEDGVSRIQKLQMMTQEGGNVNVAAIRGNFDDAQSGVKAIFGDPEIAERLDRNGYFLSSANSINWGRLAPQIVYYISAYCDLLSSGKISPDEKLNITVPTGNFGNILAAYIAKKMGLPIGKLICASNSNNVLTDFIATGTYDRNRKFHTTMSPSMDILISSNLERLLMLTAGAESAAEWMRELNSVGRYTVSDDVMKLIHDDFCGYFTDEDTTRAEIRETFSNYGYLSDTHTAVALSAAERYIDDSRDASPMLVCSTASPYKFASDVYFSVSGKRAADSVSALGDLSEYTKTDIPAPLGRVLTLPVRFERTIDRDMMKNELPL